MPHDHREKESYEQLFIRFSESVERMLIRLAVILAISMLLVQALLQIPALRHWLSSVDVWEGRPYEQPEAPSEK